MITNSVGLIYGFLQRLFTNGTKGIGEFGLKIAVSVDQLGNVLMQHLFNWFMETKNSYKFGNKDNTISSVPVKKAVGGLDRIWKSH